VFYDLTVDEDESFIANRVVVHNCKHLKVVADRILPSVQHNIKNILRQREVAQNKDKPKKPLKPNLPEKQEQMRERMQQKKKKPVEDKGQLQQQLQQGLKRREEQLTPAPAPHLIVRDEPATEGEKERTETLPMTPAPEPTSKAEPDLAPIPEIEDDAEPIKPQKMPVLSDKDRDQMKKLYDDEPGDQS
jgi:hypothetical protein